MRSFAALGLAALLVGTWAGACDSSSEQPAPPSAGAGASQPEPEQSATSETSTGAHGERAGAPDGTRDPEKATADDRSGRNGADDARQTCVERCVQANQMRAEGIEQIRADCRRQCERPPGGE